MLKLKWNLYSVSYDLFLKEIKFAKSPGKGELKNELCPGKECLSEHPESSAWAR